MEKKKQLLEDANAFSFRLSSITFKKVEISFTHSLFKLLFFLLLPLELSYTCEVVRSADLLPASDKGSFPEYHACLC